MVNFIQSSCRTDCDPALIKVGTDSVVVPAGRSVQYSTTMWCSVPTIFDTSDPLVLYELTEGDATLVPIKNQKHLKAICERAHFQPLKS